MDPTHHMSSQLNLKQSGQSSQDPNIFRKCKNGKARKSHKRKCMNKKQMKQKYEDTRKVIEAFVGEVAQAPIHLVDNEYIQRGYRIGYHNKFWTILKSLFQFHNESVNVWSHLLGMLLFSILIINALYTLTTYQEMGELVWQRGIHRTQKEKQHIAKYFDQELSNLQHEICQFRGLNPESFDNQGLQGDSQLQTCPQNQDKNQIQDQQDDYLNEKGLNYWSQSMANAMHRIEGLTFSFVKEFQNFQHYIEEKESQVENKFQEWKEHILHYPQELGKRIEQVQQLMQSQQSSQDEQDLYANFTISRLNYLQSTMKDFQIRMENFHEDTINRIDKLQWLEFLSVIKPIDDIETYLNYVSKWPLFVHMISASLCLGFSAIFHLFYVYSEDMNSFLAKLDYAGITILIFGSTVPSIEYVFACNQVAGIKQFFMIQVTVVCFIVFVITLMPVFSRTEFKWLRGSMFLILGFAVSSPLLYVHYFFQEGVMVDDFVVQYMTGALIYALGAILYITKVPERCKPGAFDICGHKDSILLVQYNEEKKTQNKPDLNIDNLN
eukprot:403336892